MQWTKIPTNILIDRLSDQELVSIVKYQLLWAELEYQPDDKTALRYMTNKQLSIAKQWINTIEVQVIRDIHLVERNRNGVKNNYLKNNKKNKNLMVSITDNINDSLEEQIRLDKIRLDNNKKENNNINIIIKEKKENTGSKNKEPVVEFGECKRVRLSQTQYNNLKSKYKNIDEAIEILDTYLGCKQDSKYNNNHDHYSFFKTNSWVWNNVKYGKPILNEVKLPNGLTEKENEDRIKFLLDGGMTMEQLEKLGAL